MQAVLLLVVYLWVMRMKRIKAVRRIKIMMGGREWLQKRRDGREEGEARKWRRSKERGLRLCPSFSFGDGDTLEKKSRLTVVAVVENKRKSFVEGGLAWMTERQEEEGVNRGMAGLGECVAVDVVAVVVCCCYYY